MKNTKKRAPPKTKIQRKQQKEETSKVEPVKHSGLTVVGIGASAGGLKALQDFFDAVPDDTGLAFVVVTDLAPEDESHMAEILQNRTTMSVRQVNGKVDVEPNNVYVIPPDREIFIADSHYDLKSFAERTQQNYEPFYTLFHSNPIPTLLTRLEDDVVMNVNHAFLHYLGIPREDVVGHTAREFNLGLDLKSAERADLAAKLLKEGRIWNFEEKIALPTGEVKTVLTSLQYINIEDKDALLSTFIDITERVQAERQIRRLSVAVTKAEQKERHRLSKILHDDLQQRIFAVKMQLDNLEQAYRNNDLQSMEINFAKLEEWLVEAINITRQLSTDLSPLNLRGEEMTEVILWLASEMKDQYGLEVEVIADNVHVGFDDNLQMILFQAIRELLFNVVKHADTLEAKVIIKQEEQGRVRIIVSDEGKGFDPNIVLEEENLAHGLITIQHQLRMFGCGLALESGSGKGTHATIDCPMENSEVQT